MENIGDDFQRQLKEYASKAEAVLKKLPLIAGNIAKNFFQDNFKREAWLGSTTSVQNWKKRKTGAKRDSGRAILTDTGRGKRSIRVIQADWSAVQVGIDDPTVQKYMGAHNNGFKGTIHVEGHARIASRKVGTKELKLRDRQRKVRIGGRKIKIRGSSHQVKPHSRKMNLPERRFIGNSEALNRDINREFINQLKTI
jgi:hypothetical protein